MSSEQPAVKKQAPMPHLKTLDSWRGIGALVVVLHHFPGYAYMMQNDFVRNSYPLVDFFFTLSGFVIAANYLDRINTRADAGRFMWLRLGRIYPLHLAVFLAFFAFELAKAGAAYLSTGGIGDAFTGDKSIPRAISNVFMVHSLGLHSDVSWNRPAWSISCEMVAYIAFAALTLWGGRRWRFPLYALTFVVSMVVLMLFSRSWYVPTADLGAFRCLAGFIAGVFCFKAWNAARHSDLWNNIPDYVWTIVEVLSVPLLVWFLSTQGMAPGNFASPFIFFFFTFLFAFQRGRLSKLMQWNVLTYLGLISYSLYMTHQFVFDRMLNVAAGLERFTGLKLMTLGPDNYYLLGGTQLMSDVIFLIGLGLVIVVSHFTYKWVEEPFRDMSRDYLKTRRAKKAARSEAAQKAAATAPIPAIVPAAQQSGEG